MFFFFLPGKFYGFPRDCSHWRRNSLDTKLRLQVLRSVSWMIFLKAPPWTQDGFIKWMGYGWYFMKVFWYDYLDETVIWLFYVTLYIIWQFQGWTLCCTRSWTVHEWNMDYLLISNCREFDCHKRIPCTQIDNSRIRLLRTFASGFSMFFRPGTHIWIIFSHQERYPLVN